MRWLTFASLTHGSRSVAVRAVAKTPKLSFAITSSALFTLGHALLVREHFTHSAQLRLSVRGPAGIDVQVQLEDLGSGFEGADAPLEAHVEPHPICELRSVVPMGLKLISEPSSNCFEPLLTVDDLVGANLDVGPPTYCIEGEVLADLATLHDILDVVLLLLRGPHVGSLEVGFEVQAIFPDSRLNEALQEMPINVHLVVGSRE